jgi:hypothetical protein
MIMLLSFVQLRNSGKLCGLFGLLKRAIGAFPIQILKIWQQVPTSIMETCLFFEIQLFFAPFLQKA